MSKQSIGVVADIDSSGDVIITLDNGETVTYGTASAILDEVTYDG
jgi:hypothetical protein